jgi:hypothetical protein
MARYFFNVHRGNSAADEVGEELATNEAAWQEAMLIAGDLFKDISGTFRPGEDWAVEVTDSHRNPLYFIRISAEEI